MTELEGSVLARSINGKIIIYQAHATAKQILDGSSRGAILIRNVFFHRGRCCFVKEISTRCFANVQAHLICIPRNIKVFKEAAFSSSSVSFWAFEFNSGLELVEKDSLAFLRRPRFIPFPNRSFIFVKKAFRRLKFDFWLVHLRNLPR
jgi:hypothetical protein